MSILIVALSVLIGCVQMPATYISSQNYTDTEPLSTNDEAESEIIKITKTEPARWYQDELPVLEGVSLVTELEYYAVGTSRLLAIWENNSEIPITYSEPWQLEKFYDDNDEWVVVKDNDGVAFVVPGYDLAPGMSGKHTYWLNVFRKNIEEGLYRIKTDYHDSNITGGGLISYGVFAEFIVTNDSSLLGRSELDYDDLENSTEMPIWPASFNNSSSLGRGIDFPVRVYKNRYTYDTVIIISGEDYYSIAEGAGQWGVVSCNYFADGKNRYLIYSYSRDGESGEKQSFIGVFDLNERKVIYRSEPFAKYDITVNERSEERHFNVSFMNHFEDGHGGGGGELLNELGYLKYEDGEFNLYFASEYNENKPISGLSFDEPPSNTYIFGYFTHDGRHPFYYVPDDDAIGELIGLINEMDIHELTPMWWQGHDKLLGCFLVHDNKYYEVWSNGVVALLSSETSEGGYAVAPELNDKFQWVMQNTLGISPFEPETIKGIISARLDHQFLGDDHKYTQIVTDPAALSEIESMLSNAGRDGMSGCPFYEAFLTLALANGEEIFLALASDSCCEYMVNGMGFNYKPAELRGVLDSGGNEMLFKFFDEIPILARPGN